MREHRRWPLSVLILGLALLAAWALSRPAAPGLQAAGAAPGAPLPCGAASWAAGAAYPTPIESAAAAAVGNAVYVFGGEGALNTITAAANKYDPVTDTWTPIAPLPAARKNASVVSDGTYIYILNGWDSHDILSASLYRYNPATNSYATLNPPTVATAHQAAAYLNGQIYRIGGANSGGVASSVEVYTVAGGTWATVTSYPTGIEGAAAVGSGNFLYSAGGWDDSYQPTAKTYRYDPALDNWSDYSMVDLPAPVNGAGSAFYNGRWILAGGSPAAGGVLAWSPSANTWTSLISLPTPVFGPATAAAGGHLFAIGGDSGSSPSSGTQIYTETACATSTPLPTQTPGGLTATPVPSNTPTALPTNTPGPSPTPCPLTFSDVHPTDYFATPVLYLACHGVVSGYADGTFRPYNNTTRAQMVKIVVLGLGVPSYTPPAGAYTFADLPPSAPFWSVIEAAAHAGVVSGYACGGVGEPCDGQQRPYFRPNANVTRGQLAKIVVLATAWALQNPANAAFADVLPGSAFYSFVATASCHGIISGYACGGVGEPCDGQQRPYFRPGANATRGQIAKIVYGTLTAGQTCGPVQ